ncbi:TonB-dependent receptor plug domain-containing protein [Povalibacter sp.]|uniref:TonB-dependent receptor plug domain-containing protein n=1 Tax=Povalibacter sp. TaxID=1962978 RepID=UPI002F418CE5
MRSAGQSMRSVMVAMAGAACVSAAFAGSDEARIELEEIIVTGSRLRLSEVEGPSPVTMFSRVDIDALGVSSVAEVLKYLPQQPYNRPQLFRTDGAQYAELRGLGADTTLVLINGRRTVPAASSVVSNAFDLNSIPLAAVERVEVLSDAASAVYGADAVGGVVNIILKRDIAEPVVALHYGAARGGAEEQRASISAGHAGERLHVSMILDYLHTDVLLGEERDLWRNQDYRRFGSVDQRSTYSNPGNVYSLTGDPLPGLSSPMAAVPQGSTGVGLTPADFVATDGQQNRESSSRYDAIVPEQERVSAAVFGEYEFGPQLTVFGEAMFVQRDLDSAASAPVLAGELVPVSNAFNPFGETVLVDFLVEGAGARHSRVENELLRGVVGARGLLGTWDWEVSVLGSREDASSWTTGGLDAAAVEEALASSDPTQALNVFQDGPGGSDALLRSLIARPVMTDYASDGAVANAFVRGSLGSLPAGSVEAVVGAEWRRDAMFFDSFLFVDEDRRAAAAFAELNVPLVSEAMGWLGVKRLSLTVAARYDDYSDFGSTTNPQVGMVWMPVADLTVRASYGTSFRPPSLFELYAPRVPFPLPVSDPRRNDEIADAVAISGGNPDLLPVEGESLTAGFVWTPSAVSGLRMAASWWQIELDQRVSFLPYQVVMAYESLFADRVVREAPTPADVAAGLPGRLVSVDISRVNFGTVDTRGVDASVDYGVDTDHGRWQVRLAGTWVDRYESDELPDSPPVDHVGVANVFGTITRWQGNAAVNWTRGAWGIGVMGRYIPAYDDAVGVAAVPTGRRIPSQTLMDVQVFWDSDEIAQAQPRWWQGVRLTLGATNVLDEPVHFAEIGDYAGFDLSQGDLRQRFIYLDLSKRF